MLTSQKRAASKSKRAAQALIGISLCAALLVLPIDQAINQAIDPGKAPPSASAAAAGSFEVVIDADGDPQTPSTREFAGASRYETSIAAAKQYIETARAAGQPPTTAIIASGVSLIDAAAAAGLARAVNAPVLLTPPSELFVPAAHLLESAGVERVIVVGGEAAISAQVFAAIQAVPGVQTTERIAGANRFDTAARIAAAMASQASYCNSGQKSALLVAGDSDSLADVTVAGPMSYAMGLPVLLASAQPQPAQPAPAQTQPGQSVPAETLAAINTLGIAHVVIIGGQYSIGDVTALEAGLRSAGVVEVTRLTAANQFATAVTVLAALKACLGSSFSKSSVALISNTALPDGISAAPMLGQGLATTGKATPALLVGPRHLPAETKSYLLETTSALEITTVGGVSAVSSGVAAAAVAAANGDDDFVPATDDFSGFGDPDECRLAGFNNPAWHVSNRDFAYSEDENIGTSFSVGFPLPSWVPYTTGPFKVAVLYVDFWDAPAYHTTTEETGDDLDRTKEYLEAVSYGNLDVEFTPLHNWIRAPKSWRRYAVSDGGSSLILPSRLMPDIIPMAEPQLDFSFFYDTVMVILPSTQFNRGVAELPIPEIFPEDYYLDRFSIINSHPRSRTESNPYVWWDTAAHELMHNLGLTDLYPSIDYLFRQPSYSAGTERVWTTIQMGLMGLVGHLSVDVYDDEYHFYETYPSGWISALEPEEMTTTYMEPQEMLAWSRWQLDWIEENQVACMTGSEFDETIRLDPISDPNNEVVMVMVPVTETYGIVIESRRITGYDRNSIYNLPCCRGTGEVEIEDINLAQEGVVIYEVDTSRDNPSRASANIPILFWLADTRIVSTLDTYPVFAPGQIARKALPDGTFLEVFVESDIADSHTVRVRRT